MPARAGGRRRVRACALAQGRGAAAAGERDDRCCYEAGKHEQSEGASAPQRAPARLAALTQPLHVHLACARGLPRTTAHGAEDSPITRWIAPRIDKTESRLF